MHFSSAASFRVVSRSLILFLALWILSTPGVVAAAGSGAGALATGCGAIPEPSGATLCPPPGI